MCRALLGNERAGMHHHVLHARPRPHHSLFLRHLLHSVFVLFAPRFLLLNASLEHMHYAHLITCFNCRIGQCIGVRGAEGWDRQVTPVT